MKVKKVIFVIISALIFIFMLAVLELNKNTLFGFVLAAAAAAGFYAAHRLIVKKKNKWDGYISQDPRYSKDKRGK